MVAQGDVALARFPFSEHETVAYKLRPVLVLAVHGDGIDQAVWLMMITGNARRFAHPSTTDIPLPEWQSMGLAKESVLRTTRVWTAEARDIERVIGSAPADVTGLARESVRQALS